MSEVRPEFVSDEPDKGKAPPAPFTPDESEREAEADEGLGTEEAPPITGVEGTIPRHPLQEAGPVGPSPLGPEGGRIPTEAGEQNIDELTR